MDLHLQEISFTLAWIGDRPFKDNTVSTAVLYADFTLEESTFSSSSESKMSFDFFFADNTI